MNSLCGKTNLFLLLHERRYSCFVTFSGEGDPLLLERADLLVEATGSSCWRRSVLAYRPENSKASALADLLETHRLVLVRNFFLLDEDISIQQKQVFVWKHQKRKGDDEEEEDKRKTSLLLET